MSCEWAKGEHPNEVLRVEVVPRNYHVNCSNSGKIFSSKQAIDLEGMPEKLAKQLKNYQKWMKRFPTIIALANQTFRVETVFTRDVWSPLVYASPARNVPMAITN